MCFPPAVSRLVVPIISCRFPIVFPVLVVTSPFLLLRLPSLPVSCPATTRSIALAFPSCSSPWFLVYPDPFPVASPAFPNSDRASLEHIQEPYLHPDLQATLWLRSAIGLFTGPRNVRGRVIFEWTGRRVPDSRCGVWRQRQWSDAMGRTLAVSREAVEDSSGLRIDHCQGF